MQFTVLPVRGRPVSPVPGQAFLVRDNWDDYSFKTTFQLLCVDPRGEVREIGAVKIGRFGMTAPARTPLPEDFETLEGDFFSLGLRDTYYERLRELGPELQRTVLRALNDISLDLDLFSRARTEDVTGTSLLRTVTPDTVIGRFRGSDIPAGPSAAITDVTRRHLFDALRSTGASWSGSLDEVAFLRRLYDLDRLTSHDPRFATAEDDIVQHRYNNPEDWEDDWVFGDDRFQLAVGADEVLLRFLAEMIHPAVRTDPGEVQRLLELVNDHLAPDGYELAETRTVSGYPVYGARRIPARPRTAHPAPPAATTAAPPGQDTYAAVRRAARGERKDYACPRKPVPDGAQADVFEAIHKPTGTTVALKKLHSKYPAERQVARMKREIEVGQHLEDHPHAMPVLDFGADHTWFVMPWAQATAAQRQELLREPAELRALVDALVSVLAAAHEGGWLHRDIKPSNILHFDGRWTLADWGIVRRPRGQTTKVGRTGRYIGTEGFAAPELSVAPHEATASSDIYSVGRVVAWALTGKLPETNLPLMPPPGPWRSVVRATTHLDPLRRPQSVGELLALIDREHADVLDDPFESAQALLEAAGTGDAAAADALLALVGDHPEDYELHVGVLARLDIQQAGAALQREPVQAHSLLRALAEHVHGDDTHMVQFGDAAAVVIWLHGICAHTAGQSDWDLLEEAAHTMCTWDGAWDQWNAQDKIIPWLRALKSEAASVMAAVLREHPESAQHFSHIADDRTADPRIRQAVRTSTDTVAVPVRQAVSGAGTGGGLRVGQGLPDREREMRVAYQQLAEAGLGQPAAEAWAHGPAALQDLHHERDGEPGWTLCLVPGRPAAAISAPVWQAIVDAGRHAPGPDPLAAIGFPTPAKGTDTPWVIPAGSRSVDLDGGSWGAGRLTCSESGMWRWQPIPRFSLAQGRSAEIGTAGQTPALRVRAVVNLPWDETSTLEISKPQRTLLEQQLPYSAVAGAATLLSRRRGAELPAALWARGPFSNSTRSLAYTCTITAPDGRPAVTASVMLTLPTPMQSTVVACADVRIESTSAWAAALAPGWDTQLGLDEVQAVLLSAWETAAELLPEAVGASAGLSWAAPPTTELRITCEQPADNGVLPGLDTLVDLTVLGTSDRGPRPQLAVTVTAAPAMGHKTRQSLLREALVYMAREFGYIDAEADLL